jgi:hypothetical protein
MNIPHKFEKNVYYNVQVIFKCKLDPVFVEGFNAKLWT